MYHRVQGHAASPGRMRSSISLSDGGADGFLFDPAPRRAKIKLARANLADGQLGTPYGAGTWNGERTSLKFVVPDA
jgi:hypothetical protein